MITIIKQVNGLNNGDTLTDRFSLLVDDGHGGQVSKEIVMTIDGHTDTPPVAALLAPPKISGGSGNQDLHASLGIPPMILQGIPTLLTGWGISDGHGHSVTTLQGQFGTLHINPATGQLDYDYQTDSGVQKSGTDHNGNETDTFLLTLAGDQNSQVAVHLHLHSQSIHGNNGHHIDQTILTGMDITPIAPPPPPPSVSQNDESDFSTDFNVDIVVADETSQIDEIAHQVTEHLHEASPAVTGAAAYLDALGISPAAPVAYAPEHQLPADMDIVMAEADHLALGHDDTAQVDLSDPWEHLSHEHDQNQQDQDDTDHHQPFDNLPYIGPNS